ncbi:MAG: hypothetical protein SF123_07615 [Chloroflexota bacterium]|nr:hypothetical protein [Chloroflexota bacterium]
MTIREMLIAAGYEIVPVAHTAAGERAASILDQLPSDQQGLALDILEKFLERV